MLDFYSDTKTKPSKDMLLACLEAPLGDEQQGEDPTTNALCRRVAHLLGKEDAVFLPSGSLGNIIGVRVHTHPGDEIICERNCHILNAEVGGAAALNGVMVHPLDGTHGMFTPEQVNNAIRPTMRHSQASRLLCVEQTANLSGGTVWPLDQIQDVAKIAKQHGLATHMDGARLFNAVVQSGIDAGTWAEYYDSVWVDFSKGLGAPIGAVLAGSKDFICHAWRMKQQLGGSMRQSGVIASMCLYALDHNINRLADDHTLATWIAEQLSTIPAIINMRPVQTNIVIFDLAETAPDAETLVDLLKQDGIIISVFGKRRVRIVTHMDVDKGAAEKLCASLRTHLS